MTKAGTRTNLYGIIGIFLEEIYKRPELFNIEPDRKIHPDDAEEYRDDINDKVFNQTDVHEKLTMIETYLDLVKEEL